MIPVEAVEAAAKATADINGRPKEWPFYMRDARAALEAAAPYMLENSTPIATSWWRAIDANGDLLAETSSPRDFEALELLDTPGVTFHRLYEQRSAFWVQEDPRLYGSQT